ncbi:MAG: DNA mismatch repair protein MutT [Clostridium celatum]|nr:DNA mismatch repair protein MutT [Clostridium celatum]MDU2489380.1 DNA mismatch repair protein MutT [Clostridium celatum]MDU4978554.1 DNA mismatch repair protein MutT [Clostridium celatum]
MVTRCSIIIYDDFGNVLIAERGKRNERTWGLFSKEMKGKETEEKCISKAVDKDIKCTVFDLKPFKEYVVEDEKKLKVFTGSVKEYITCHKSINNIKWISKRDIEGYIFNDEDKMILNDYFQI